MTGTRRGFLSSLLGVAATSTLDPDMLIWKPGKLISIPARKNTLISPSALTADMLQALQTNTIQVKLVMRHSWDFEAVANPVGRMLEIQRPMRFKEVSC